jgi:hypothetical protein
VIPAEIERKDFPQGLLAWAGHRAGGVRRLFDDASGRPSGVIVQTPLLKRLADWAGALVANPSQQPKIVLLLGGPGNGKTEAVEATLRALDSSLDLNGALLDAFRPSFASSSGRGVPRMAEIDVATLAGGRAPFRLQIVQDASVQDPDVPSRSRAELLLAELSSARASGGRIIYLACVNRGVLDDALIAAADRGSDDLRGLLEAMVEAVSMSATAPSCWPLAGDPDVAVWPMDVESLLVPTGDLEDAPARQLLTSAVDERRWPTFGTCAAGDQCPFCSSRRLLSGEPYDGSLLRILRWYELATGKRWSFRDLFSLTSYLLAGVPSQGSAGAVTPCEWAAVMIATVAQTPPRPDAAWYRAPFVLMAAQYQHALFGRWDRSLSRELRAQLKELRLDGDPGLMGLYSFLVDRSQLAMPGTLPGQLDSLGEALDPALADPDEEVALSSNTTVQFRDIDARFSQSVRAGLQFLRKYQCLAPAEISVLLRLADSDDKLSDPEVRRRRPAVATRVQSLIRDFSSRVSRRTLGVRNAVVRDAATLRSYERVMAGDAALLSEAVKEVTSLLHERDRWFVVPLNTTFGEPLPPPTRRAVLRTEKQRVRARDASAPGRPVLPLRFLTVGTGSAQSVPLTFELYRSVRELRAGMVPASLPRAVIALLDTTRGRLAGQLVRDDDSLEQAELRVGTRADAIVLEQGEFVIRDGSDA